MSIRTTGSQSKKVATTSLEEQRVKIEAESLPKFENVLETTRAVSSALQPKAGSACQMFKAAMEKCPSLKDMSINETEDLHELEMKSVLHRTVNLVLVDTSYSTRSAGFRSAPLTI